MKRTLLLLVTFALVCAGCKDKEAEHLAAAKLELQTEQLKIQDAEKATKTASKSNELRRIANQRYGEAISNVFQMRVEAMQSTRTRGRGGRLSIDDKKFLAAIKQIDTKRCPVKFQQLWLDYIEDCELRIKNGQKITFEALVAGVVVAATGGVAAAGLPASAAFQDATKDDPQLAAWYALRRYALIGGVESPPEPH